MMKYILALFSIVLFPFCCTAQTTMLDIDSVHKFVEKIHEPDFKLSKYLCKKLRYPAEAVENNIQGDVYVQFIVSEDGNISDAKVVGEKKLGGGLEQEAIRLILEMPKWKPAQLHGKNVKAYYTLPIKFRLG